jgi:thiol-disulfide isomerase/thioredoxin
VIERFILALVLLALGYAAYRVFTWSHLRRATTNAETDPILELLKPGVPAIVYFTTPTCIPCRTQQQPTLERLQTELGDAIQVVKIDAIENTAAADRWGVFSAPTTFVLDGQKHVREVNYGVADALKLRRQIEGTRA